jgi:hypothetical protein
LTFTIAATSGRGNAGRATLDEGGGKQAGMMDCIPNAVQQNCASNALLLKACETFQKALHTIILFIGVHLGWLKCILIVVLD